MARVNIDDDVEKNDEFWALLELVGGDRDRALGKLVRFFRIAQERYGHGEYMSLQDLESRGLTCMIESGWAIRANSSPTDTEGAMGFRAKGEEKHFGWYRQRCQNGEKQGREGTRGNNGRFTSERPANHQPLIQRTTGEPPANPAQSNQRNASGPPATRQPLSPALAPSPALSQKKESEGGAHTPDRADVDRCIEAWLGTLDHFGAGRPGRTILPGEDTLIFRAIQRCQGVIPVELAIEGARYEPKDERFNPAKFLSLRRILNPDNLERFMNLAVQERHKQREAAERRAAVEAARSGAA